MEWGKLSVSAVSTASEFSAAEREAGRHLFAQPWDRDDMKQKDVFLESEGNAWFTRNSAALRTQWQPAAVAMALRLSTPK